MELLRIIKKMWLYMLVLILAIAMLCLFDVKKSNDRKLVCYIETMEQAYEKAKNSLTSDEAVLYIDKEIRRYFNENADFDGKEQVQQAYAIFLDKKSYVENFSADLNDKIERAHKLLGSLLYMEKSNFGRLNLIKTSMDMSNLTKIDVSLGNTTAIEKLLSFKELPLLCIIVMVLINIVFVEEKSNGVKKIVYASAKGRFSLGAKRCFILLLASTVVTFVANMIAFGIYLSIYGGIDDLGSAIQSGQMFSMFTLEVNVWQFFLLYCMAASIGIYGLSVLILFLFMCIRSNKLSIMLLIVLYVTELLLYKSIASNSKMCFLKYINIYNMILPAKSYMFYENWGYNGFITDVSFSTIIMTIIVVLLGIIGVIIVSVVEKPEGKVGELDKLYIRFTEVFQRFFSKVPFFVMELYKFFVLQRGIVIILVGIYLICSCKMIRGVDYKENNNYINNFYDKFEGSFSSVLIDAYIEDFEKECDMLEEQEDAGSYQELMVKAMKSASVHMQEKNEYIKKIKKDRGIDVPIVNSKNYDDVFGERLNDNQESINLICIFAVILIFAGTFSYERQCNMNVLSRTYKNRKKQWLYKGVFVFIVTFAIWFISVLVNWLNITDIYDFNYLQAPIQSLMIFEEYPFEISIFGYILTTMIYRFILLVSVAYIVFGISAFIDYMKSIIVSVIFLIPYLLYQLGLGVMFYLSLVPAFDISRYWRLYGPKLSMYYIPILLVLLAVIMCRRCYKKIVR